MKLQQLYHGGQLEVRDVAGGGFVIVARDELEAVTLRFERPELEELTRYLNERLRGASDAPSGLDVEGCAALEAAAAREAAK